MNDRDYIIAAIELTCRWFVVKEPVNSVDSGIRCMDVDDKWFISEDNLRGRPSGPGVAALAAHLVALVDQKKGGTFEGYAIEVGQFKSEVFVVLPPPGFLLEEHCDEGRHMNTIKAIVDSEVLEK